VHNSYASTSSADYAAKVVYKNDKLERINEKGQDPSKFNGEFSERAVRAALHEPLSVIRHGTIGMLNSSTMQRMNIHAIQRDLVHQAHEIVAFNDGFKNEVDWTKIRELMRDYCRCLISDSIVISSYCGAAADMWDIGQAWRDWEIIEGFTESELGEDPFILLTTGPAVMAFGAGMALLAGGLLRPYVDHVDLGPQDVLAATAAYAAVLVVFISQGA
jgi:hypothetical protein